jgi:hypothetical protein
MNIFEILWKHCIWKIELISKNKNLFYDENFFCLTFKLYQWDNLLKWVLVIFRVSKNKYLIYVNSVYIFEILIYKNFNN